MKTFIKKHTGSHLSNIFKARKPIWNAPWRLKVVMAWSLTNKQKSNFFLRPAGGGHCITVKLFPKSWYLHTATALNAISCQQRNITQNKVHPDKLTSNYYRWKRSFSRVSPDQTFRHRTKTALKHLENVRFKSQKYLKGTFLKMLQHLLFKKKC